MSSFLDERRRFAGADVGTAVGTLFLACLLGHRLIKGTGLEWVGDDSGRRMQGFVVTATAALTRVAFEPGVMSTEDGRDDAPDDADERRRVEGEVIRRDDRAFVAVPDSWVGEDVIVTRLGAASVSYSDYTIQRIGNLDALAYDVPEDAPPDAQKDTYAGPDVHAHLLTCARDLAVFAVGLASSDGRFDVVTIPRESLSDGLLVLGGPQTGKTSLLATLAWQAIASGGGAAVFSRGEFAPTIARSIPERRFRDLQAVGGTSRRSVNLVDVGVSASEAAFLDAVDAVTDGLTSLLTVLAPQLRDCIREFVMAAKMAGEPITFADLRELVRYGLVGDSAAVPEWVPEKSHDLLYRVDAVDTEAIEAFLDSLAPFFAPPVQSLLSDPDPDVSLVDVVREQRPLVVHLPAEHYDTETWNCVSRALVHCLWGLAREFVPDQATHPFYLFGDEFGSVLDAADDLDRLYARLHVTNVTAAFAFESPTQVDERTWTHLTENVGAAAVSAPARDDADRLAMLPVVDASALESVPPLRMHLSASGTAEHSGPVLVVPPQPPRRGASGLDWTA